MTPPQFLPNIMIREREAILEKWVKKLAENPNDPTVQAAMLSIDRILIHCDYLENKLRGIDDETEYPESPLSHSF